jgi:hypothetical protein
MMGWKGGEVGVRVGILMRRDVVIEDGMESMVSASSIYQGSEMNE